MAPMMIRITWSNGRETPNWIAGRGWARQAPQQSRQRLRWPSKPHVFIRKCNNLRLAPGRVRQGSFRWRGQSGGAYHAPPCGWRTVRPSAEQGISLGTAAGKQTRPHER